MKMGRSPIDKVAMTGAERLRRYRLKHGVTKPVTKPGAADAALAQELARARAEITELRLEAAAQAQAIRDAGRRRAPASRAEKPPLPPDEQRERTIKALTTANRTLRAKLAHMERQYDEESRRVGAMSFRTFGKIAEALHPDTTTEAKRSEACGLFTEWKKDAERAARRRYRSAP
jgi:hypothetical protein